MNEVVKMEAPTFELRTPYLFSNRGNVSEFCKRDPAVHQRVDREG